MQQLRRRPNPVILQEIRTFIKEGYERGKFTQSSLAARADVSQASVSRILNHEERGRLGTAVKRLCKYAGVPLYSGEVEAGRIDLQAALEDAWDGTPEHAMKLARIIRAIGPLCK